MSTSVEIPTAAPTSAAELAPAPHPNGGQGVTPSAAQGLELWLENFRKYEATLVCFTALLRVIDLVNSPASSKRSRRPQQKRSSRLS